MYRFHAPTRRIDWLFDQFATSTAGGVREFVRAVNRAYYRHFVDRYEQRHVDDIRRQFRLMMESLILAQRDGLTIVNVGGGIGFEYEQLLANGVGWKNYFFIEPDEEMLETFLSRRQPLEQGVEICRGTFDRFSQQFKHLDNKVIMLNSCLHHLIWIEQFLDDVKNCLNPGDYLLLCHEPNNDYLWSPFMFLNYAMRGVTTDIVPRKLGLWKSHRATHDGQRWKRINHELLELGAIVRPLQPLAIRRIIDYGIGTKGDWKLLNVPRESDEGHWTPKDLARYMGPAYKTVYLSTYRILGDPGSNRLVGYLNKSLERFFRLSGSVFSCALQRVS
jgi:2-polyprenyl-3-methyl-5-hydroxy-6-metoxy-1,4-benzoquinol methylase